MAQQNIVVEAYNTAWPAEFEKLKSRIWPVVSRFAASMEHVGSTSVPGLAAKPVIDMDIVAETPQDVAACIKALAGLGYVHQGNLGIEGREAFRRPQPSTRHNLYVCLRTCPAYRNHILLRDFLRADPQAVRQYSDLKRKLALQFGSDINAYCEAKTEFIAGILRRQGMTSAEVENISQANKVK